MFYDLDWYIESRMRKTVKQIFDEVGEERFRKIEHNMLHEVAEFENVVVVLQEEEHMFLRQYGLHRTNLAKRFTLKASPETLHTHLKMGTRSAPSAARQNAGRGRRVYP